MTSQEIARICGVSRTTVSRVINNDPKVKEATRNKVLEAMKVHNYVPIASARRLAGVDSNIIGLFIMEVGSDVSETRVSKSTYFSKLVNLIIDQSNLQGYHILVSIVTSESQLEEARNLYLSGTISSGIFVGVHNQSTRLDELVKIGLPMVIIDRQVHGARTVDGQVVINLDNRNGGYIATKHLIKQGHKKILHLAGDMRKLSGIERCEGYQMALEEAAIPSEDTMILYGDFDEIKAYDAIVNNETFDYTAIFASNDVMAIGAISALSAKGIKVPEEVAVIGFDDIDTGKYITPSLTTIHAPFEVIAEEAVKSLIYYYEHGDFEQPEMKIRTSLVKRASV